MKLLIQISLVLFTIISSVTAQTPAISCEVLNNFPSNNNTTPPCNSYDLTIDEITRLPILNIKIAFHYIANTNDINFTPDPNDPILLQYPLLEASVWQDAVFSQMNNVMEDALIDYSPSEDTQIRFVYVNGSDWEDSAYFYPNATVINVVPDALNIVFENRGTSSSGGGVTNYGSNEVTTLNNVNSILAGGGQWWTTGRVIIHEFLHTRFLNHTFHCNNPCSGDGFIPTEECGGRCALDDGFTESNGCFGQSTTNSELIMGYNGSQTEITICELEQAWNYMLNNPAPFQAFLDESVASTSVYEINNNQSILWDSGKKIINSDLIIKDGSVLDIRCEVEMGGETEIIVESGGRLIIDGGTISSFTNDLYWDGVEVIGTGSTTTPANYDVILKNGALLRDANREAITMLPSLPHSQAVNFGNGRIFAKTAFSTIVLEA